MLIKERELRNEEVVKVIFNVCIYTVCFFFLERERQRNLHLKQAFSHCLDAVAATTSVMVGIW